MKRPAYDTVEGIGSYLTDLAGLNRLIEVRREAGYKRKESLGNFLILGRWETDGCGNFGNCTLQDTKYRDLDPAKLGLDPVIDLSEDRLDRYGVYSRSVSLTRCSVPPIGVHCRECGKGWDLALAHDATVEPDDVSFDLGPFVGKTYKDLEEALKEKSDGYYIVAPDHPLRHDRFIDPSPHPSIPGLTVNERGWTSNVLLDYVFQEGDETYVLAFYYTHKVCYEIRKRIAARKEIEKIFAAAGIDKVAFQEIPNGYCPCASCPPWYFASTLFGDIKIGWRKRVINLDWSATGKDFRTLFTNEDVTKWEGGIHCWGPKKASEYLRAIQRAAREGC